MGIPPSCEWIGIGPEPEPAPREVLLFIDRWIEAELLSWCPPPEPTPERRALVEPGWGVHPRYRGRVRVVRLGPRCDDNALRVRWEFPSDRHGWYKKQSVFAYQARGALRWYDSRTGNLRRKRGRPKTPALDDLVTIAVDAWPALSPSDLARRMVGVIEGEVLAVFGQRIRAEMAGDRTARIFANHHPEFFPLETRLASLLKVVNSRNFAVRVERWAKFVTKKTD